MPPCIDKKRTLIDKTLIAASRAYVSFFLRANIWNPASQRKGIDATRRINGGSCTPTAAPGEVNTDDGGAVNWPERSRLALAPLRNTQQHRRRVLRLEIQSVR